MLTYWLCFFACPPAVQGANPAFETLDADQVGIRISNASSGDVCSDDDGPSHVCKPGLTVDVIGQELCQWSEETQYPCTRFGYQFDYEGVDPAESITCKVERSIRTIFGPRTEKVTGTRTAEYTVRVPGTAGRLFHHGFQTYAPVEHRVLVGSVHTCYYRDVPLYKVEYIMRFEPE